MTVDAARDRNRPTVTYLVANHDNGRFLPDCIASLLAQRDTSWLAVICDDASSDDSIDVIRSNPDPRIRLVRNQRNTGYIATLRRLIDEASTDVVAILDPDDAIAPDTTAHLIRAFSSADDVAFVYSRFAECGPDLNDTRAVRGSAIPPGGSCLWHGTVGHILSFRRSAYHATAGLDDAMLFAEDRDLVYKLEEVAQPVFVDDVLYLYRVVPGSQSHHPQRRERGARNAWRARRAALARRSVRGLHRVLWEVVFLSDYLAYSDRRPAVIRRVADLAARRLGRLTMRPAVRSAGLRRHA